MPTENTRTCLALVTLRGVYIRIIHIKATHTHVIEYTYKRIEK